MASARNWTPERLTRQDGKTFVITGANSGIGFEAGKTLAAQGGEVILMCRSRPKAEAAAETIGKTATGSGAVRVVDLNLASLASVRTAAAEVAEIAPRIDALITNAGAMMPPDRLLTEDGFELQFGVNHLGHFLLAGQLAPNVIAAQGRFVAVSSAMHKPGRISFDDPNSEGKYDGTESYAQSKLANALFARELNNRYGETHNVGGYICHPGYAATPLQTKHTRGLVSAAMKLGNVVMAQSAERGSWPTSLCAAGSEAEPGKYYGPTRFFELRGPVGECKLAAHAQDDEAARKLWNMSEDMVGEAWTI